MSLKQKADTQDEYLQEQVDETEEGLAELEAADPVSVPDPQEPPGIAAVSAVVRDADKTVQQRLRGQLEADMKRFLDDGGVIEEVPRSYRADPPKKPQNNYGRGSI